MSWSDRTVWSPLKRDCCKVPFPSSPKIDSGGGGGGGAMGALFIHPQAMKTLKNVIHEILILRFIEN
jgi:hypothetical protein